MTNRSRFPLIFLLAILAALLWSFAGAKDYARTPLKDNGKRIARQSHVRRPVVPSALDEIFASTDTLIMQDGPDGVTIDSIVITNDFTIEDLDVKVDITHGWVRDLTLILRHVPAQGSPDSVLLLNLYPYGFAEDMTQTWFADEASYWILEAAPPMTGSFRPMESLTKFNGRGAAGVWYMEFRDRWAVDTGRVNEWALEFNHINSITGQVLSAADLSPIPRAMVSIVDTVEMIVDTVALEIDTVALDTNYITDTTYVIDMLDTALTRSDGSFTFPRLAEGETDFVVSHPYAETYSISDYPVTPGTEPYWLISSDYLFLTAHALSDSFHIPDNGSVNLLLTGFEGLPPIEIADVEIALDVTHPFIGDLRMNLTTGSGDRLVNLIDFYDDENGDNLLDCRFDDEATRTIFDGIPPFTGSWQPTNDLSFFDGLLTEDNWELTVFDKAVDDSGDVRRADLTLVYREVGIIEGHALRDSLTGLPLVGAQVSVAGTELSMCTGQFGEFSFTSVPPGEQTIEFDHKVYAPAEPVVVNVVAGETEQVEVELFSIYGPPQVRQSRHGDYEIPDAYYSEPDTTTPEPDDSLVVVTTDTLELTASNVGFIADVNVILNLDHTWLGDLSIRLFSPNFADSVVLVMPDTISRDNFVNTIFDDQSCEYWQDSANTAGFTGTWLPAEPLSVFDSIDANGTWYLEISDNGVQDVGTLHDWSLEFFVDPTITENPPLDETADDFTFHGNYPNPFNPSTTFSFDLIRDAQVKLILYNVLGQQVATLLDKPLLAGIHQVAFDANTLPSGVYFARLSTPHQQNTRKIILLK
ncbi:proprotein convertase P-domain-containing protein [bacterium]|nr:proprotein convertase P-domain-containing protein [bacterium]